MNDGPPRLGYFLLWAAIFAGVWLAGVAIGDYVPGGKVPGGILAVVGGVAMVWVLYRTYRIFRTHRG